MLIDINAWLGSFPFRSLRDNTPETLIARMDRSGIDKAAVSQIEAVFHRNPQPANEKLAESVAPFGDRFVTMATINPTIPNWRDDLAMCHETLGMRGVRLFPQYQGYEVAGPETRAVLEACAERGLAHCDAAFQHIRTALETMVRSGGGLSLTVGLLAAALLIADEGRAERAVELHALACRDPHVSESRWFEDVSGKHIAAAAESLPPDVVAAAQERGRARDLWETAKELLAELEGEI